MCNLAPGSDTRVDRDRFWALVETSKPGTGTESREHAANLKQLLKELSPSELIDFHRILQELRAEAYTADLWNMATIVCFGYCGDDGFTDFRDWLILQGRAVFEDITQNPDHIVVFDPSTSDFGTEALGSLAYCLYLEKTGVEDFPCDYVPHQKRTLEKPLLGPDELKQRYPDIWHTFNDDPHHIRFKQNP